MWGFQSSPDRGCDLLLLLLELLVVLRAEGVATNHVGLWTYEVWGLGDLGSRVSDFRG